MKHLKISSGDHHVGHRVQFCVGHSLDLDETWLQNELRERVGKDYSGSAASIEVAKQNLDPRYCITFSPVGMSGRLEIKYLLQVLDSIEQDVEKAMKTRYLMSGLVEREPRT